MYAPASKPTFAVRTILIYPSLELEVATAENFDAAGYLLANPDVAAWSRSKDDARLHLDRHGLTEGRQQVPPTFLKAAQERRLDKYRRFESVLDAEAGDAGVFNFLEKENAFPVGYGGCPLTLADYETESAHGGLGQFEDEVARNPEKLYLEIGCGLRQTLHQNCLYLEVYPSRSADIIVKPACHYPIASASIDGIGCFAVLEHVTEPWVVADEFRRILKPGGLAFIDWPFLQPVHGYPSHYYNATRAGLARMFESGFEVLETSTRGNQTPDRALSWILRGWLEGLNDEQVRREMMGKTVEELLAEPPRSAFWKRVLAATSDDARMTYACGNTLVAKRQG